MAPVASSDPDDAEEPDESFEDTEDLEDGADDADPDADELPPAPPVASPRRENPAHRQPKPADQSQRGPAWWVGKDRTALNQEAEQKRVEMSATRIASRVPGNRLS